MLFRLVEANFVDHGQTIKAEMSQKDLSFDELVSITNEYKTGRPIFWLVIPLTSGANPDQFVTALEPCLE